MLCCCSILMLRQSSEIRKLENMQPDTDRQVCMTESFCAHSTCYAVANSL